jgi:hypothetical protein
MLVVIPIVAAVQHIRLHHAMEATVLILLKLGVNVLNIVTFCMLDGMRSAPPYCDAMLGDVFMLKSIAWNIEKITFAY